MNKYISNPRKSLRLCLACPVSLEGAGHHWTLQTEDVGPNGFCVTAPAALATGELLKVVLLCPQTGRSLAAGSTVAWCSPAEPWRVGLSFVGEDRGEACRWFDELSALHLGHIHERHNPVPDRLPLTARLQVGPVEPPEQLPDEEAALILLANRNATLQDVVGRLAPSWTRAQRALLSMLGKGCVTLDLEGDASHFPTPQPGILPAAPLRRS
jgi:hypothetical protein